jgi:hypothetical protein
VAHESIRNRDAGSDYPAVVARSQPDHSPEESLVESARALSLSVRDRRGAPDHEVDSLLMALERCRERWTDKDCVPRGAVNVLVDLLPSMDASLARYPPHERAALLETYVRLGDAIRAAVAVEVRRSAVRVGASPGGATSPE